MHFIWYMTDLDRSGTSHHPWRNLKSLDPPAQPACPTTSISNTPALTQLFCLQRYLLRRAMVPVTSPWRMLARREQWAGKIYFRKDSQRIDVALRKNGQTGKRFAQQMLDCVTYCFDHLVRARLATVDLFILIPISAHGHYHLGAKRRLLLSIPYGQGTVEPICIHGRLLHQGHFIRFFLLFILWALERGFIWDLGRSGHANLSGVNDLGTEIHETLVSWMEGIWPWPGPGKAGVVNVNIDFFWYTLLLPSPAMLPTPAPWSCPRLHSAPSTRPASPRRPTDTL